MNRLTIIVIAGLALALILFGVTQCHERQAAATRAKLSQGQAGAAIESGRDTANTIGNRMEADAAADTITRENMDAIRKAEGADAPVAAPARDAGIASLCRRDSYKRDPRCMQLARP